MNIVDLSALPEPQVIETLDYEVIFARRKAALLALYASEPDMLAQLTDALTRESEPVVKLLQESSYLEMMMRQRVNNAASAVMLARATDSDLDNMAANFDVVRKQLTPGDSTSIPPVLPTFENDDEFRTRTQMAFEGLSVAGPRDSYRFHALSADPRVKGAGVVSPAPCFVDVYVLSREGDGAASAELVSVVNAELNDEDIRPVADRLTVLSTEIVRYEIVADVIIFTGPPAELVRANAMTAINAYADAFHNNGMDITRAAIIKALNQEGVQNVILHSPAADMPIATRQAAYCSGITLTLSEAINEPAPY